MKSKKIIFWDLMKKPLEKIDDKAIYVLFGNNNINLTKFKIKPIVIKYHGALIEDLNNNKVIFDHDLGQQKINQIQKYANQYKLECKKITIQNKTYEIQLSSNNYYRMLVMPSFIKNEYHGLATYYNYPFTIDKKEYQNFIINDDISILKSILDVIDYLNLQSNDILDLVNVCYLLRDVIINQGYCMIDNKLRIKNDNANIQEGESLI